MFRPVLAGKAIHLVVESRCGGTTLALQIARHVIEDGGRVIWACNDFPDNQRFADVFKGLNPVESSRFHALNLGGPVEQVYSRIQDTMHVLPDVRLVVIDEWCPQTGVPPKINVKKTQEIIDNRKEISTLLISKGGVDMENGGIKKRGNLKDTDTWYLKRKEGDLRTLSLPDDELELKIEEAGFMET